MHSATVTVGARVTIPYPAPLTLESDNPGVLAVTLTRDGASVDAVAVGSAWLTFGLAADLQVRLAVEVVEAGQMMARRNEPVAAAHATKK